MEVGEWESSQKYIMKFTKKIAGRGREFRRASKTSPCILVVESVCVLRVTSIRVRYIVEFMHMRHDMIINITIINVSSFCYASVVTSRFSEYSY